MRFSYVNTSLKALLRGAQTKPNQTEEGSAEEAGKEGESDLEEAVKKNLFTNDYNQFREVLSDSTCKRKSNSILRRNPRK